MPGVKYSPRYISLLFTSANNDPRICMEASSYSYTESVGSEYRRIQLFLKGPGVFSLLRHAHSSLEFTWLNQSDFIAAYIAASQ